MIPTVYEDSLYIHAQSLENKTKNSTIFYGCEEYNEEISRCSRLHNNFKSYIIKSKSSILYNATDTPMYVNGKEGLALQMYANHLKSITFSNTSTILPNKFSISFWIKGVTLPDKPNTPTIGHIISQFNGAQTGGWSFVLLTPDKHDLTKESARFTVYNTHGEAFASKDVPIFNNNDFTHIVGTFDGSSIKIYKDAELYGETKFNGTYNNKIKIPLTLGVSSSDPMLFYWTGNIDDLRYYDKVISTNEIRQIFNDPISIAKNSSKDLIGHWRFNGSLDDISGNNHNGSERTIISSMVFAPDGRLFFSEKDTGNIRIMKNGKVNPIPFATLYDHYSNWEQGLLGLAIDPDFKKNHFLYQFYTTIDNETRKPFNRIVRFTDVEDRGLNQTIILDRIPASNGLHSGGAMVFGPDDKLYVTIGDGTRNIKCGNLPNSTGNICPAQDPSSLWGKVLRLNRDGSTPKDNPYPGSPVYNIGHRNMYGIAFDKTGFGLVSENGAHIYDEINTVEKGKNYGSPTLQPSDTDPEIWSNYTKPLRSYYESYCLTQMIYYDGDKVPRLKNRFLVAALSGSNTIYALEVDRTNKKIIGEEAIKLDNFLNNQVVALAQSPSGDIYYGAYAISKLDSIKSNNSTRLQTLFPIEINYSSSILDVNELSFFPSKQEMILDLEAKQNSSDDINNSFNQWDQLLGEMDRGNPNLSNSDPYLNIKIPKELLNEIRVINATTTDDSGPDHQSTNQRSTPLDFHVENLPSSDHLTVKITLMQGGHYKLFLYGK